MVGGIVGCLIRAAGEASRPVDVAVAVGEKVRIFRCRTREYVGSRCEVGCQ